MSVIYNRMNRKELDQFTYPLVMTDIQKLELYRTKYLVYKTKYNELKQKLSVQEPIKQLPPSPVF